MGKCTNYHLFRYPVDCSWGELSADPENPEKGAGE